MTGVSLTRAARLLAGATAAAAAAVGLTAVHPVDAATYRYVVTLEGARAATAAARPPATPQERWDRAASRRPSATARGKARDWLVARGHRVERSTDWTLVVTGPRLSGRPPRSTSTVLDSAAGLRPRAVPVGYGPADVRSAYDAVGDGRGTTVATVQFSGWRPSDADVYAEAAGSPLEAGQVVTVPVGGARGDVPDGAGGDQEVSLDVASVLATAPRARQRVYVAPNTTVGVVTVWDALATYAEQAGLVAVSTSWGACEEQLGADVRAAVESSLQRLVAAGTTVLAASGDSGAFDCGYPGAPDTRLAVDHPAASPLVVAVGGTTLSPTAGGGWSETAWSDRSAAEVGFPGHGSGGGMSTTHRRPAWQQGLVTEDRRGVPDLAAVADPRTGIGVYGPLGRRRGWSVVGGTSAAAPLTAGLLASAVSASGRTLGLGHVHTALYAAAKDTPGAFRDVTTGDNLRFAAGPGYDLATGLGTPQWSVLGPRLLRPALTAAPWTADRSLTVSAYAPSSRTARYAVGEGVGCEDAMSTFLPSATTLPEGPDRLVDLVLAVRDGDDCQLAAAPLLVDTTAPVARASLRLTSRQRVLAVGWGGSDPAPASGVARTSWRLLRHDGRVVASGLTTQPGSVLRAVGPGTYVAQAFARDRAGTLSAAASSAPVTVS